MKAERCSCGTMPVVHEGEDRHGVVYFLRCQECHKTTPIFDSKGMAISEWNEHNKSITSPKEEAEKKEKAFIVLVHQMREAQKEYFRGRRPESLAKSKELEKRVDLWIKEYMEGQGKLFE